MRRQENIHSISSKSRKDGKLNEKGTSKEEREFANVYVIPLHVPEEEGEERNEKSRTSAASGGQATEKDEVRRWVIKGRK